MPSQPLWIPSPARIAGARLTAFAGAIRDAHGLDLPDYEALWRFSVERPADFWTAVWDFCGIRGDRGERAVVDLDRMPGARFFPDATLNFAGNVLRRRDDTPALIFNGESVRRRTVSHAQLYTDVRRFAAALTRAGLQPGDRVAGYMPNMPEAIVAALGAAAIGAVWTSCSPDFGVQGVLDRFGQTTPRVLVAPDGYFYAGRAHALLPRLPEILAQLPSIEHTIVVSYVDPDPSLDGVPHAVRWDEFLGPDEASAIELTPFPFDHPLYILYSSGTTGVPKCIVHGAGGTLIQHLKEHQLHCDVKPGDRMFYFTTCGWMMWNWLLTGLASEATLLLYDGSPFHPDGRVLFDFADDTGTTLFGTSARFIDAVAKAGLTPRATHRLETVRTITSTGSPLSPESFDFVYRDIKRDVHLASISGGTDIVSCFVLGNPISPVWRGEIQGRGLGMKVDVFDQRGTPVVGEKGELVCTMPFPSMPVAFWDDPDGARYRAAYFTKFPGVWHHGDYAERTPHGGVVIHGRSDAVLNPGGVRIGTAEIYRQVDRIDEVVESLVVGQRLDHDERIVLFVRLREGLSLTPDLEARIRTEVRTGATPRHVPARIVQVTDIPRTRSGKIVELAVRDVVHGLDVRNREAIANPEALEQFRDRPELRS
ncbi:MAG: acetoacetate--CoA ligase [Acidobacteriota bacterium]